MSAHQKIRIITEEENERYLKMIEDLLNKGSDNLTNNENELLIDMTRAVQVFEQSYYEIPKINSLEAMLELKMYELKLSRSMLSQLLGIGNSKLSDIMNGKRRPDVPFLKALHQKLGIDAGFLLNQA